jgi:hypothetical protein
MAAKRLFSSPTFRFSIRQLLLGTALVAVACVALRSASPLWVAALLGLTLLLFAAAVPLAVFRQGTDRAYWFGFALFGWLYMLLLAYGWSLDPNTSQNNPLRTYSLVTSRVTTSACVRIFGPPTESPIYPLAVATTAYPVAYNANVALTNNPYSNFAPNPIGTTPYIVPVTTYTTVRAGPAPNGPALDDFVNVAHAFWAILIAVCGGWFTCWLYATRPAAAKEPPVNAAAPSGARA